MLAKPGFGALLLWGHRNIDLDRLGLHFKDPEEHARNLGEKGVGRSTATSGGVDNGVSSRVGGTSGTNGVNTTTETRTTTVV